MSDGLAILPQFSTGASQLDANAQAHSRSPLFAFGDLTDNAKEAGATHFSISAQTSADATKLMIEMVDDGCGMDEAGLKDGLLSSSKTSKRANVEVHYGMGSTTALPFLSTSTLSFSKKEGILTCGLLSTTYSHDIGSAVLVVPQVTWIDDGRASGPRLLTEHTTDAEGRPTPPYPLTRSQRKESLREILRYTPFETEQRLLAQFDRIVDSHGNPSAHGTLHICYSCDAAKWDVASDGEDIRLRSEGGGGGGGGGGAGGGAGGEAGGSGGADAVGGEGGEGGGASGPFRPEHT